MIDQCAHEWHQTLLLYFRSIQIRFFLSSKTTLRRKRAAGQILHEALVFHILCHTNRRPRNGAKPWDKLQESADPFDSLTVWHEKVWFVGVKQMKDSITFYSTIVPLRLAWIKWAVQHSHARGSCFTTRHSSWHSMEVMESWLAIFFFQWSLLQKHCSSLSSKTFQSLVWKDRVKISTVFYLHEFSCT